MLYQRETAFTGRHAGDEDTGDEGTGDVDTGGVDMPGTWTQTACSVRYLARMPATTGSCVCARGGEKD
jgi:hypothetical protein